MFPHELIQQAAALVAAFEEKGLMLVTAESCTGGLIAGCLTEVAGSSAVVERGFVTYSNNAKIELLGVPPALLQRHGAVSDEVARAMAAGALTRSPADLAVSATGVAGPGGGSAEKPIGLVFLGGARRNGTVEQRAPLARRFVFSGDRDAVRLAAVTAALELLAELGS
ncbi:MAG: CinA family protein [Kiloniellales bacterium]